MLTDDTEGIALVPSQMFEARLRQTTEYASAKPEE